MTGNTTTVPCAVKYSHVSAIGGPGLFRRQRRRSSMPTNPPKHTHSASAPTSIKTLRVDKMSKNASMRSQISVMRSDPE